MLLWVNALAVRSGGGVTVLEGLGQALAEQTNVRFLCSADLLTQLPEPLVSRAIVADYRGMVGRLRWEQANLSRLASAHGVDAILGLSNTVSLMGGATLVRQATIIQNIAPLSTSIRRSYGGRPRARLEVLKAITLRSVRAASVTFAFTRYCADLVQSLVAGARVVRVPPGGALSGNGEVRGSSSGGNPYILILADLYHYKGIEDAIRAVPDLRGLDLVVCGAPAERDYAASLRRLASGLGIGERVTFLRLDTREEAVGYMRRASCVLQTSRLESLGLPVIEALSMGIPVVSTDIPAAREVGGEAVGYYAPGDVDALVTQILDGLGHSPAKADTDHYRSVFDWRRTAASILEALAG